MTLSAADRKRNRDWGKAFERRVAKFFGTIRTALSGSNSGGTASDTRHEVFYIEAKGRAKHAVRTLFDDTKEKANKEGKYPIVALGDRGKHGILLCIHTGDCETWEELWEKLTRMTKKPERSSD